MFFTGGGGRESSTSCVACIAVDFTFSRKDEQTSQLKNYQNNVGVLYQGSELLHEPELHFRHLVDAQSCDTPCLISFIHL